MGIKDILREDIRLFISNPDTEKASYEVYYQTLQGLMQQASVDVKALDAKLAAGAPATIFGQRIHHREAPQALYNDKADVAMVYYHLALRYTRVFSNLFDFIPLGGTKDAPQPNSHNVTTTYYMATMRNASEWGERFENFLLGEEVTRLYALHGLCRPEPNII